MNYNNFTQDQKESVWLILLLIALAAACFTGAGLLFFGVYVIISMLLFFCGLFLIMLAVTGIYVEFIEKPRDDKKYSAWHQD